MKKIIVIIISLVLLSGCNFNNESVNKYKEYIQELKDIEVLNTEKPPLDIDIIIEKYNDNLYSYSAIINKNEEEMNDVIALLIHNKETENIFPSIGVLDDKISVNDKQGIKLSGYVENIDNIEFRLMISYTNSEGKKLKYYYITDNPTIID